VRSIGFTLPGEGATGRSQWLLCVRVVLLTRSPVMLCLLTSAPAPPGIVRAAPCPAAPVVTCNSDGIACANADAVVPIDSMCSAPSGVSVVYSVDGAQVASATCPRPGTTLTVLARPEVDERPGCAYNDSASFTVTSEHA
jgi:hypothetical protein